MKILFTTLIPIILLIGCRDKQVLTKSTAAQVYIDLMTVEEMHRNNSELLQEQRDSVFQFYNITPELYHNTIESFKHDEDEWNEFFELAQKYLDTLKVSAGSR